MKRLLFFILVMSGCSVLSPLQKGKLISVFHLIEIGEYEEAKNVVEEMITDKEYSQWPRTWYARGLICQDAYIEGIKKKDKKKTELYPDQLFVAWESFEKARSLDKRGRFDRQLAPRYVLLSNDLKTLGETNYNSKKYADALKAFEQAVEITQNPILTVITDTSLIYNTALAAYESKNKEKIIEYFTILHNYSYSPNATHHLFTAYLEKDDTTSAEKTLIEGVEKYEDNENLVLLLADLLYQRNDTESALKYLDNAFKKDTSNYIFPYTKGLIHQKTENYFSAIEAYKEAVILAPDELMTYVNIATCYFNIGVEIEENSRTITNNRIVLAEKAKSTASYEAAVVWLDKAYEKKPKNRTVLLKLYQLYHDLRITDKARSIERMLK